jgi:hypothetical protein
VRWLTRLQTGLQWMMYTPLTRDFSLYPTNSVPPQLRRVQDLHGSPDDRWCPSAQGHFLGNESQVEMGMRTRGIMTRLGSEEWCRYTVFWRQPTGSLAFLPTVVRRTVVVVAPAQVLRLLTFVHFGSTPLGTVNAFPQQTAGYRLARTNDDTAVGDTISPTTVPSPCGAVARVRGSERDARPGAHGKWPSGRAWGGSRRLGGPLALRAARAKL